MSLRAVALILLTAWLALPSLALAEPLRDCPPPGATHHYFPVGTFEATVLQTLPGPVARDMMRDQRDFIDEHDARRRVGLGEKLRAMGEPSLSCGEPGEQYRFLWSRSFLPYIVIRVQAVDGAWRLVASEFATRADATVIAEPTRHDTDGWRLTDRWAPQDGAVRAAGLAFLRLTGWDIPADEIY